MSVDSTRKIFDTKTILNSASAARLRIAMYVRHTPLIKASYFTKYKFKLLNLKLENMQFTGSFKIRGAYNHILSLSEEQKQLGVVVASGGNHGLSVAFAGRKLNIPVTVFLPENASQSRKDRISFWGANITCFGKSPTDAIPAAKEFAAKNNRYFIHPFDSEKTIEGTTTLGLEILEDVPDMDLIFVAVGGGGLLAGIASVLKSVNPKIHIVGVDIAARPKLTLSLKEKKIITVDPLPTIADTLGPTALSQLTFDLCSQFVDEVVQVTESELVEAMKDLWLDTNQLVEPAGAAVLAACKNYPEAAKYAKAVAVICGGNADVKSVFERYNV